ncbi:Bifunctional cytochrome P450/NADPH--P450 reductase 2 [Paludisphaera borealis]|uniref:NADPH--hemoprotein reductase n=2 Tax=Paludisphaera borealis TaxID=1387353 RepID=A0A1U7CIL0_9BACT|nr:Bifunctional cytochrome P450/NADPH--P450 reductase 2 [Paludisphaera borealis]
MCIMTIDSTSDRIVQAALRVFALSGVQKSSLDDVAAAAGVTRVTIYRRFDGKPGLIQAVCDLVLGPFERSARAGQDLVMTGFEAWIAGFIGDLRALPVDNFLPCLDEIHRAFPTIYEGFRLRREAAIDGMFESALRVARDAGRLRPGLHPVVVRAVFRSSVIGLGENPQLVAADLPGADVAATVIGVFLNGVLVPATSGGVKPMSEPRRAIPQPTIYPVVRNLPAIDQDAPIQSMMRLADEFGPFYRLSFPGQELLVASSHALVDELCDPSRFDKKVHEPLRQLRDLVDDGLFTAETSDPNWGAAHRILMPAFAPGALHDQFDGMADVADQMLLKWERYGPAQRIDVADEMTRLTLDTIALCGFGYRFNSFYRDGMHPFVGAMVRGLAEAGGRSRRVPLQTRLMLRTRRQYAEDLRLMRQVADELIAERKKQPRPEARDLLNRMLLAADPATGERLSEENIRNQMVTFLIAGHETTSGLLTFALYELLRNPEFLERARSEVDAVLGGDAPRVEHLARLGYLDQVLKETLRLWPTAPAFAVQPEQGDAAVGGYPVRSGETVLVLLPTLHRDPAVWGADADRFDPDRMAPEAFDKLPPNAWKPFGTGQRACIGRGFAMQEATLVLASVLQRFDLAPADPDYQLRIKETLTLKPDGFFIRARRRDRAVARRTSSTPGGRSVAVEPSPSGPAGGRPLRVLFGSNSGSSEAFAQRIATDARARGYAASLGPLDSAAGGLGTDGPVVIVTASYEGQPPENARRFVQWLEGAPAGACTGVRYAVFGCGNRDWARTYQAVPKKIDELIERAGGTRLVPRGEADGRGDFFGDFDRWYASFWGRLDGRPGPAVDRVDPSPALELEFVPGVRDSLLRQNHLQLGVVVENRELVDPSTSAGRSKRHVEIALPEGASYRAGDYLAVLPRNPTENVDRALRRFGLPYDAQVVIHPGDGVQTFLPTDAPVMAGEVLASYVELGHPATRLQIERLAAATPCPPEKRQLESWAADEGAYAAEVRDKRVSVLDLMERFASCDLSFAGFLQMLPPLKPRQYSISSSPLWSPDHCSLTFGVVSGPAWSGRGVHHGVASTYLADARPGAKIAVAVRPSHPGFHLPDSPAVPILMIAAGTGVAPFRGFVQELALRSASSTAATPAVLYFGCSHPDVDYLYRDEFAAWEQDGVVRLRPAFSRAPVGGVKYVQDRLWEERREVMDLIEKGGKVYVCGDGRRMAPEVRATLGRIYRELAGAEADRAEEWLADLEATIRYVVDVFA